ncbi:MAG: ATP-dependent metallopeptidase FtsH/Yme1/Tma family protein [Verrucomicrobia bacterium]|nr:ATP-dependent metallopeptidase FtsH/Yme1/Tma family protein [Verrucomicrobiota bacterium]
MFNKNDNDRKPPGDGRDNRPNLRGLVVFISVFLLFGAIWTWQVKNRASVQDISYQVFREKLDAGQIQNGAVNYDSEPIQEITGIIRGRNPQGKEVEVPFRLRHRVTENLSEELAKAGFSQRTGNTLLTQFLLGVLPILVFVGLLWLLFWRQVRSAGKGTLSFGKSRARMLSRDRNRVTFKDVAGIEEAKEEVQEIVEFLKDPKRFQRLGGRIPKGALMVGPPGTGKTLLAKAIAGEAEVPFFSISGSDFVEMFVGVGASRVRDMFEQGRKHAPCLIFIDEIDAVGRSRFSGIGGGHDEREQTLNALLVEMDGFDTSEGIIIIAATNRPDVLDSALRRPGRFDREIVVDLPDLNGREQILKIHARNIKLSKDVDLKIIARGTPGFSGADLANLCNEAALIAARDNKKAVGMEELEESRDKVRWGRERRSRMMDEKEKKCTAYHEAGHALVQAVLDTGDYPVHKVTIIPRGQSLGSTMSFPTKDKYTQGKKELLTRMAMIMAGRIAEEMMLGDITSGAYGDIRYSTAVARKMVCEWGMSEKLGNVHYGVDEDQPVFLGRELTRTQNVSEATARTIDEEIRRITDEAYQHAKSVLTEHKDKLITLAESLLEFETLDGEEVLEIIRTGKLTRPPDKNRDDSVPPPLPTAPVGTAQVTPPLPGAPGIEEAPANA